VKTIDDDYQQVLEQINDGVYFVDPHRVIQYWNHSAERISGYSRERVLNHPCYDNILVHIDETGEQLCVGKCPLAYTLEDGKVRESRVYLHHIDGHRVPVIVRVMPLRRDGQIVGAVEVFTEDISLATALAKIEALQRDALLDALTGIANRRLVTLRLETSARDFQEQGSPYGVIMIDIDHFKTVNDTYGHPVGDRVLRMVACSLSNGLRPFDFVGRWGGEEFVAVVPNVDEETLRQIGDRLRVLVAGSHFNLEDGPTNPYNGPKIRVTVSLGGAIAQEGECLQAVLDRADRKLYESKQAGRDRFTM
jgi:diguanylate cyclase (GGDEF)-like protein/PAS domain S-box-containing protein